MMTMKILFTCLAFVNAIDTSFNDELSGPSQIRKVVTMLEEMKAGVEKEGEEDTTAYDKYACWCKTNDAEKTQAIIDAEKAIADLTSLIEELAALQAKLNTEIEELEGDIAAANEALATAAAEREKEKAEFETTAADMKNALSALSEAIEVLSKVQLMQKQGKGDSHQVGQMLLQVKNIVTRSNLQHYEAHFHNVMQSDLWDFLASVGSGEKNFLPTKQHDFSALAQPIEGGGAAAGAKSYNSRSGQIFGILQQMREEFGKDLSEAQKEELRAMISFNNLKTAKMKEIDAATDLKNHKSEELAKAIQDDANAKEDIEDTKAALSADQQFLMELKKNCKIADEEYAARQKMRSDEIMALSEALKMLTDEDARDLFGRATSFLQINTVVSSQAKSTAQNSARFRAVTRILQIAKKTKNFQLAALAVSTQLDAFTKVKEAMDKFLVELKKQQKDEYEKNDFCKAEIDKNEDDTKVKTHEKEDLDDHLAEVVTTIDVLTKEIDALNVEVGEMQVSLKRSGEDRKAENQDFQAQVADQRAVMHILNKVLDRLKEFYDKKGFLQTGKKSAEDPPPKPKGYEKSAGAGGALQMISMIIEDAGREEAELVVSEQDAQEAYAKMVQETNSCLAACDQSITEKTEAKSTAEADKAETEAALLAVNAELTSLKDLNIGLHKDCDFLLENFEIRQKARKEEMDAIVEAKAILSGAK